MFLRVRYMSEKYIFILPLNPSKCNIVFRVIIEIIVSFGMALHEITQISPPEAGLGFL